MTTLEPTLAVTADIADMGERDTAVADVVDTATLALDADAIDADAIDADVLDLDATIDAILREAGVAIRAGASVGGTWPVLDDAAYHGVVGEFVKEAAPHTEGDPVGILVTTLALLGCVINKAPHIKAGNERHGVNLNALMVGSTSKGGKGTTYAVARALVARISSEFVDTRIKGGFGSGEAVIDSLQQGEGGSSDIRLLVYDPEFARTLKVGDREGSILSMVIRDAWDGRPLEARSRGKTTVANDHHVSVVGHITVEELRATLTATATYGGFSNRFLFVLVRRGQLHPEGGNVPDSVLEKYAAMIRQVIQTARHRHLVVRTPEAEARWKELYYEMAEDEPGGLLGAVIGRDAPQVLRLSLLYALLDGSCVIDVPHLEAAWAVWRYCRASAELIFGDAVGDQNADKLLGAIRAAGDEGLTFTEQSRVFSGHLNAKKLEVIRARLEGEGLIVVGEGASTGGRPATVSVAVQ
jgi:hypothetical protein